MTLENENLAQGIDLKETSVVVNDPGNRAIVGYTTTSLSNRLMFTHKTDAYWSAENTLRETAYPVASIVFPANRKVFKLQPGDLFRLNYSPYSISEMVCRVLSINEESLGSERIVITAREAIEYVTEPISTGLISIPDNIAAPAIKTVKALLDIKVIEAPYLLAGDEIKLLPIVAQETGDESGYRVYESVDGGTTYREIAEVSVYNPHGLLTEYYEVTGNIDDSEDGIVIDFDSGDYSELESISRTELFSAINLCILDNEIMSFETIELVSGTQYRLTGINRGMMGTEIEEHSGGANFFFIGDNYRELITFEFPPHGATRYYKFVPFSNAMDGEISNAIAQTLTYTGVALAPYPPTNVKCNDEISEFATYSTDCVLTWTGTVRGGGSGYGDPDSVTDAAASWEGYFKVEVYSHATKSGTQTLERTVEDIDALTWTYTEAMNISDYGATKAPWLTFIVTNYIVDSDTNAEYESDWTKVIVKKV